MSEYQKRSDEYYEWRQKKAAEFLKDKKRKKCYICSVMSDADDEGFEIHMTLSDDIIAQVLALKEEIANDPSLKTDEERADDFHDRLGEIDLNIDARYDPEMAGAYLTGINLDDYIYMYRFDIHLLDLDGNANGRTFPASAELTDEEYIDLLAYLIDQPDCSFQHLAYLSPKFKAIHEKVSSYLHNYNFCMLKAFCHDHDYAIRMTELRNDAKTLLKQLKKKKDTFPYIGFLKDFMVNLSVIMKERMDNKSSSKTATADSTTDSTGSDDQQKRIAELANMIDQFTKGDNFLAADLLKRELKRQINKDKLTKPYPLLVNNNDIYIEFSGNKREELDFKRRGPFSRTLYIFFLRQIERANKDRNVSPYLSQEEMKDYADELLKIYESVGGRSKTFLKTVFLRSSMSGDFNNACSDIRTSLEQFFNKDALKKDYGKCYSLEIMGGDCYGNPRYGINLDIDDFDLGRYSIDKKLI